MRERREEIGKKTHTGTATTNSGRKKMEGIYEIFQFTASPEGGCTVSKDLYNSEGVENLLALFQGIVRHKRLLAQSIQARAEYANIVNALKSPETAEQGVELGEKALKLIAMIEQEADIRQTLWEYEAELWKGYGIKLPKGERYPFLREEEHREHAFR